VLGIEKEGAHTKTLEKAYTAIRDKSWWISEHKQSTSYSFLHCSVAFLQREDGKENHINTSFFDLDKHNIENSSLLHSKEIGI